MAVEGVVAPIVVPLMVPPVTVTDGEVKLLTLAVRAVSVVPEAVANPSQTVEVTPEKKALCAYRAVEVAPVNTAVEATEDPIAVLLMVPPSIVNAFATMASVTELAGSVRTPVTARFVVVVFVPVAFVQVRLVGLRVVTEKVPKVAEFANKLVDVTVVA
jgi:hypothetical protein